MVTVIKPTGKEPSNLRLIYIPFDDSDYEAGVQNYVKQSEKNTPDFRDVLSLIIRINEKFNQILSHSKFIELKKESFDLVVIGWYMNDFHVGIAAHFKCPAIISVTSKPTLQTRNYVGNPPGVSYLPASMLAYKGSMNFCQRLINFVSLSMERLVLWWLEYYTYRPLYHKNFPTPQYPPYDEAMSNIALVLLNHHFSQGNIGANMPAAIEVGGMHIKTESSQLPDVGISHLIIYNTYLYTCVHNSFTIGFISSSIYRILKIG